MKKEKVSLIMVVHGNPKYIFKAIESAVRLVSEIIMVDIGVDGELRKKLLKYKFGIPLRFVTAGKPVPFVELIREEIKVEAKYDYILFLDEDEVLSKELIKILSDNIGKYDYFAIPRKNIIFNKWIQNSQWWPDYQVRLFRKSKVTWPKIIHSQPKLEGNGYSVAQDERFAFTHYNYDTVDQYILKAIRYAKVQAGEILEEKRVYLVRDSLNDGISQFMTRFFAQKGYKDGLHGLVLATLQMFYSFLVFCYYFELKKFEVDEGKNIEKEAKHFFENGTVQVNHWLNHEDLASPSQKIRSKLVNKLLK